MPANAPKPRPCTNSLRVRPASTRACNTARTSAAIPKRKTMQNAAKNHVLASGNTTRWPASTALANGKLTPHITVARKSIRVARRCRDFSPAAGTRRGMATISESGGISGPCKFSLVRVHCPTIRLGTSRDYVRLLEACNETALRVRQRSAITRRGCGDAPSGPRPFPQGCGLSSPDSRTYSPRNCCCSFSGRGMPPRSPAAFAAGRACRKQRQLR